MLRTYLQKTKKPFQILQRRVLTEDYSKKNLGLFGEDLIAKYLNGAGFSIISRNFQKRGGEIDLIAKKDDLVVFVEVKLRQNVYFNNSEVIVKSKIKKIIRTAKLFLQIHGNKFENCNFRFDVAIIEKIDGRYQINYIENAFMESDINGF